MAQRRGERFLQQIFSDRAADPLGKVRQQLTSRFTVQGFNPSRRIIHPWKIIAHVRCIPLAAGQKSSKKMRKGPFNGSEAQRSIASSLPDQFRPRGARASRVQWLASRQPLLGHAASRDFVIALRPHPTGETPVGTRGGACAPQFQLHCSGVGMLPVKAAAPISSRSSRVPASRISANRLRAGT